MSIVSSKLRVEGATGEKDIRKRRSYTNEFLLITDDEDDLQAMVMEGMHTALPDPVPDIGTPYSVWVSGTGTGASGGYDGTAYCLGISVKRLSNKVDEKRFWVASVKWGPPPEGKDPQDISIENPRDRPVLYSLDWAQFSRKITRDIIDDRLIANSAGDLYDVERDDARPVLVAVKNEWPLSSIIAKAVAFKNAVNNDTFYGAPAYSAKIESITSGQKQIENGFPFYPVTYRIQFTNEDEGDWRLVLENKGNMAYDRPRLKLMNEGTPEEELVPDPLAVKRRVIVLAGPRKGEFLDEAYLNYDGTQRADDAVPGALPIPQDGDDPFSIYPVMDFSLLGIGTSG